MSRKKTKALVERFLSAGTHDLRQHRGGPLENKIIDIHPLCSLVEADSCLYYACDKGMERI
jgi:hypothetical protein